MELSYENLKLLLNADNAISTRSNLYALVDHGAIPGLTRQLDRFGVKWASLFAGSTEEGALQVAPILVELSRNGALTIPQPSAVWLCAEAKYTSSMLLIESSLPISVLSQKLAFRLDAQLPGCIDVLLRYFDPRIFDALLGVLTAPQMNTFLSVAKQWHYVDRRGEIKTVISDEQDGQALETLLVLSSQQEAALVKKSLPDHVGALVKSAVPEEFGRIPSVDWHDFLCYHINMAQEMNINLPQELSLYCSLALIEGEGFFETGPWPDILRRVKNEEITLYGAIENCSDGI